MALIELLLDLLPLRQCYIARDWPPPDALTLAIDRMMPAIRFFRLGDGNLAPLQRHRRHAHGLARHGARL